MTWERANINNLGKKYAYIQQQLFVVRFKSCLVLHKKPPYTGEYKRKHVVQQLLGYARDEDRERAQSPVQDIVKRPFTEVLASPRGAESEHVWRAIIEVTLDFIYILLRYVADHGPIDS
jgi:hypothetical protein